MDALSIIKTGANIIDDPAILSQVLDDFVKIPGKKILIHGGGHIATRIGAKMGITSEYVNGRRITDEATLELVTMVYGGLVNRNLVAALQQRGEHALGLTGADGAIILAHRRPVEDIDYGWVGDTAPEMVHTPNLKKLIDAGFTPVIAPLSCDGAGHLLNTNADTIASVVSVALSSVFKVTLLYCFDQEGVLDGKGHVVPFINEDIFQKMLKKGELSGGILPKLEGALTAIRSGVHHIWMGNAEGLGYFPHPSPPLTGTLIGRSPEVPYCTAP